MAEARLFQDPGIYPEPPFQGSEAVAPDARAQLAHCIDAKRLRRRSRSPVEDTDAFHPTHSASQSDDPQTPTDQFVSADPSSLPTPSSTLADLSTLYDSQPSQDVYVAGDTVPPSVSALTLRDVRQWMRGPREQP